MELILGAVIGLLVGGLGVFQVRRMQDQATKTSAKSEADKIINRAKAEAAKLDKDAKAKSKDFETRARRNVETEIQKQKNQLKTKEGQLERRLKEIEDQQKAKLEENEKTQLQLKQRDERVRQSEQRVAEMEKSIQGEIEALRQRLEGVAGLTQDEARRELVRAVEEQAKTQAAKRLTEIEQEAEREGDRRSKKILAVALSRFASEYTSERTVSVLSLPGDEMKGKIIGREGRNIRALEAACGVDFIVDDTPEAVVISGFDPVRRELAKRSLEKLMEDGRVHPARIEEVVEKQRSELNRSLREEGEKVCVELGIGTLNPELLRVVGSLKYRQTNSQNTLNHCLEVAYLSGIMASEMGLNEKIARRAGLLHDIGKGVEHTVEGNHAIAGADFAKKYGESEAIVHAIRAHHNDEPPSTTLALIVQAANQLSNSRPGARRPGMENFINRLRELESVANSFDGVMRSYAMQAGKEVRVMVESSRVTDDMSSMLVRDIARKIEREMPHLSQVKVMVVRETRSVDMAR